MLYIIVLVDKYGVKNVLSSDTLREAQFYCERFLESNPNAQSLELTLRTRACLIKKYI